MEITLRKLTTRQAPTDSYINWEFGKKDYRRHEGRGISR